MYILTFNTSRSKYFQEGLKIARRLGGSWDGETMVLKIPGSGLLASYERLLPLFEIVGNWSSLRATFRGQEVDPFRFILVMHFIKECAGKGSSDPENCWLYPEEKGWGCKRLSNVQYHVFGGGEYTWNERFWYNFGRFNERNEWVIDKEKLYQRLYRHAEGKGLTLCPFFDVEMIKRSLDALPACIVPDDKSYRVHYEEEFYKGDGVKVPLNIRHIHDPPEAIIHTDHRIGEKAKKPPEGRFWKWFSKN